MADKPGFFREARHRFHAPDVRRVEGDALVVGPRTFVVDLGERRGRDERGGGEREDGELSKPIHDVTPELRDVRATAQPMSASAMVVTC